MKKIGYYLGEKIPIYNGIITIISLIILLSTNVYLYGDDSLGGA